MAFAGKWTKDAVEGGAAFFAACGIPDDKLAAAEALVSTEGMCIFHNPVP